MSPGPLQIRSATPADYPSFVRFFEELGTGDPPFEPARWQASLMPNTLLFEHDGAALGYCMYEVLAETVYLRHLVVAPEARGRGVGWTIMQELRRRFSEAGCTGMCLNVKPDNRPAIALYERAGMRARYRATALQLEWSVLASLPALDPPLTAALLPPQHDVRFERFFGLERGIVTRRRQLQDMLVLALQDASGPRGLACFDPHFPGVSPFYASDPGAARALLEAVQRVAPELPGCALVVERDDGLSAALLDAGAHLRLEVVHYHGPL